MTDERETIRPYRGGTISKKLLVSLIVIIAVASIVAVQFVNRSSSPIFKFDPQRTKGSKKAPLYITEFLDFQCAECFLGSSLLNLYFEEHPDDIFLGVKYFPLGQLNSEVSAVYAQCAAEQGKFWEMHDILFERQEEWRTMLKIHPVLEKLSEEVDLDMEKLKTCREDEKIKELVRKEKALGEKNFVSQTPTYFVNGQIITGMANLARYLNKYFSGQ